MESDGCDEEPICSHKKSTSRRFDSDSDSEPAPTIKSKRRRRSVSLAAQTSTPKSKLSQPPNANSATRSSERIAARRKSRRASARARRDSPLESEDDLNSSSSFFPRPGRRNDFIKERNSYNYEKNSHLGYVNDGFIVDDSTTTSLSCSESSGSEEEKEKEQSSSDASSCDKKIQPPSRSRQKRRFNSISSEEEDDKKIIATPIRRPSNRAKRVPVSAKGPRRRLLDQLKEKRSEPRKDRQQSPILPPKEVERVESESDNSLDAIVASREFTEIFERSLVSESGSSSFTESELSEDDDNEEQDSLLAAAKMRDEKNHCLMSILSPNFVIEDEEEVDDLVRLLDSVRRGNAELVDRLLAAQSSSKFNWTEDNTGFTLLHLAAATGRDNVVDVLLRNKADIYAVDSDLLPAVAWAARCGHVQCLDLLLRQCNSSRLTEIMKEARTTLTHLATRGSRDLCFSDTDSAALACLQLLNKHCRKRFKDDLQKRDADGMTPFTLACKMGHSLVLDFLLDVGGVRASSPEGSEEHLLHWVSSLDCGGGDDTGQAECLKTLLNRTPTLLNRRNNRNYTPLMCAAEAGNARCVDVLIDAGADMSCKDLHGASVLHLAACSNQVGCVEALIRAGHPIASLDRSGWPPLLYANFAANEDLVLTLMKYDPNQLCVLEDLLRKRVGSKREKRRTNKVVRDLITSFANQEAYYKAFNEFIRSNPSLLHHDDFAFHCRGMLDFNNKKNFLKKHVEMRRRRRQFSSPFVHLVVDRDRILESTVERLSDFRGEVLADLRLNVTFRNESGSCLGPRREFFSCLINEVVSKERQLFTRCDSSQLSFVPGVFMTKVRATAPQSSPQKIISNTQRLKMLTFLGRIVGMALCQADLLQLPLARPIIKQLLDVPVTHPNDLDAIDHQLYASSVEYLDSTSIDSLDLGLTFTFTQTFLDDKHPLEIELEEDGANKVVTDENKRRYMSLISEYKLKKSILAELSSFKRGLYQVVDQNCLRLFNPDEFVLLLAGVQSIDVDDWMKNTIYHGWDSNRDNEILWFWTLVKTLKEEEKALLLKFATGSPCVPSGGFRSLQGLSGPTLFSISKNVGCVDKVPHASTCFNRLQLPLYSSERSLRQKVLIAIRHGCEGFSFG